MLLKIIYSLVKYEQMTGQKTNIWALRQIIWSILINAAVFEFFLENIIGLTWLLLASIMARLSFQFLVIAMFIYTNAGAFYVVLH